MLSECPYTLPLNELPSGTVCHIPTFCTGIECCTYVELLKRNIHTYVFIHSCSYMLEIGIENLKFQVDLFNFDWGTEKTISVQGVFNVR